jgi:hypothetical protein
MLADTDNQSELNGIDRLKGSGTDSSWREMHNSQDDLYRCMSSPTTLVRTGAVQERSRWWLKRPLGQLAILLSSSMVPLQ